MIKGTVVVSGGTKGIGRAIADQFAKQGYRVLTSARSAVAMDNDLIEVYAVDLGSKEGVFSFADWVKSKCESVDCLVNNVGIYIPGKITEEDEGVFESQINVNLASTYHLTRALIGHVKKASKPYIFNICSTASITPYVNGGSYCISKYAQLGLTKVLREELKPDRIRVSAVLPGATLTSSWEGTDLPPERFVAPSSVAQHIWLAFQLEDHSVMEEILIRPLEGDIV